ncbi:rod shape-determining protein [Candidatus Parcubacteria bacterium]|nr:rod shape-determining protein [Candidatus Parcubacteria bacterium]
MFGKRLAIDLGTANSLVIVLGKGLVLNEPTVVAVSTDDRKVLAIGNEAKEMLGRTPETIQASRPLRDGVIADYLVTEAMLRYFIDKACGRSRFPKPEVMISVPALISSVESRAVLDAALSAGAKRAYLIPEPLAAAIGAKIPIAEPSGNMIINSGGGSTEVAIISLGGIVAKGSVRVAGSKLDDAITSFIRRGRNLLIGEQTAERIKVEIGDALSSKEVKVMEVRGRDAVAGLPRTIQIDSREVTEAIRPSLTDMIRAIKGVLEQAPPELSSDIIDKGMVMSGGTALLRNLDKFITRETGVPAHVVEEPLFCVVKGVAVALENLEIFQKSITVK